MQLAAGYQISQSEDGYIRIILLDEDEEAFATLVLMDDEEKSLFIDDFAKMIRGN